MPVLVQAALLSVAFCCVIRPTACAYFSSKSGLSAARSSLAQLYAHLSFFRIIPASAIPLSAFPSEADVRAAHAEWSQPEFAPSV